MNTKPRLIDPSWFAKPKPKIIKKKIIPIPTKTPIDNSMIINIIGLCILLIGCLCIYLRYIDRDKTEFENKNRIIGFNEYVKENIK